jgi:hypothetical protein
VAVLAERLRPEIEQALSLKGVTYELRGSAPDELQYKVTVPYDLKIGKLTRLIKRLGRGEGRRGATVEWEMRHEGPRSQP